ncbi:MAG: LysM peptidoglycan-binding domain-containing protein [Spirochaetes bacterium]|nr:LysM peptidoglycan-binding domain-containing protein [Spirochaetota bacterium]
MNPRVFQIDQECYLIFTEDFTSKKERFLRIGNSPFLKEFGENLTFSTLITSWYPGNLFSELELFQQEKDRKLIGLKENITPFITFLQAQNIDLDKIKIIFAETQGIAGKRKISEEQFLSEIKNDADRRKHSFAAFYKDGNIRIFNRKGEIFDLYKNLNYSLDEKKEILYLSNYYHRFYQDSYSNKTGLIITEQSLFIFSDNRFCCFTDTANWVFEALSVGINPEKIELLYLTERVYPDSKWMKVMGMLQEKQRVLRIVTPYNDPAWLKLIPEQYYIHSNPHKNSLDCKMGSIRIFMQNKRVSLIHDHLKLQFSGLPFFLDENKSLSLTFLKKGQADHYQFIIDNHQYGSMTLYRYHPFIMDELVNFSHEVEHFFTDWTGTDQSMIKDYISNHQDYDNIKQLPEFKPSPASTMFYANIYRKYELVKNPDHSGEFNTLQQKLLTVNGKYIRNHLIMNQCLSYSHGHPAVINQKQVVQPFILEDYADPFGFFLTDIDEQMLKERYQSYRNLDHSHLGEEEEDIFESRFQSMIKAKEFYEDERRRLREFLDIIETAESKQISLHQLMEKMDTLEEAGNNLKDKIDLAEIVADHENQAVIQKKDQSDHPDQQEVKAESLENSADVYSASEILTHYQEKQPLNWLKKLIYILLILLLLAGVSGLTYFGVKKYYPQIAGFINRILPAKDSKVNNKKQTTEKAAVKKITDQFANQTIKNVQRSQYYQFYMTIKDVIDITNAVAVRNRYHRMLYLFEKKYVKGKDPDWIYPGNVLVMPDNHRVIVKQGDTMWDLSENFLITQINQHEIEIRKIIEKAQKKQLSITDAKTKLIEIRSNSYSEMIRGFIHILELQDNFDHWMPYSEKKAE